MVRPGSPGRAANPKATRALRLCRSNSHTLRLLRDISRHRQKAAGIGIPYTNQRIARPGIGENHNKIMVALDSFRCVSRWCARSRGRCIYAKIGATLETGRTR
jgi:hypothetical protein